MKTAYRVITTVLIATPAFACEALQPMNPVKTVSVCGRAEGPDGKPLADFELQLIRKDQTPVSATYTDAAGRFRFALVEKGDYYMTTNSKGWAPLGWPLKVTRSKASDSCGHPLIVRPALDCGGSISKKGYHPKFGNQ